MNRKISFNQFEQIQKNGYSLDMLFILEEINEDNSIISSILDNMKLNLIFSTLIRKGLCTNEGKITLLGKELLDFLSKEDEIPLKRKKPTDDGFERWWKAFPGTDTFKYNNKIFNGTRSLKAKKDDCKIKLNKIIDEGEYTIDEMIAALEFEVEQKKENSIKTGTNKLSFMQNSLTYLNQRGYENFIELIKEGIEIKQTTTYGGVSI